MEFEYKNNKKVGYYFDEEIGMYTFKKGHRLMVQIQSSCFPWADRNPQTFINIFKANESDYQKAFHRLYHNAEASSFIKIGVLK